jgi:hypothetical protein
MPQNDYDCIGPVVNYKICLWAPKGFQRQEELIESEQSFVKQLWFYVRFEVFKAVTMKNAVFWDEASCRSCVNRRFGGTSVSRWLSLQPLAQAGSSLAYFFTLKMETTCSSETSAHSRYIRRHIPENDIIQLWFWPWNGLPLVHWRWWKKVLPKLSTRLHGVITQKTLRSSDHV